jgi:hypothetical protein
MRDFMPCAGCDEPEACEIVSRCLEPARPESCRWTHDEENGIWNTACGEAHLFEEGGPAENEHRFCPYCGGALTLDGVPVAPAPINREARHTTQCKRYDNNCGAVHPSNCPDCPFRTAGVAVPLNDQGEQR